jgi:hypothetical protein
MTENDCSRSNNHIRHASPYLDRNIVALGYLGRLYAIKALHMCLWLRWIVWVEGRPHLEVLKRALTIVMYSNQGIDTYVFAAVGIDHQHAL